MRRSALLQQSARFAYLTMCVALMSAMARPANIPSRLRDGGGPEIFARPKVLIFSKTNGYHHASIAAGIVAIKKLGAENGFDVDTTTDSTRFRKKIMKKYDALIFLSPTRKVLHTE